MRAKDIIEILGLLPLEKEGGFYRETYRSGSSLQDDFGNKRDLSSSIYYLLTPDTSSHLHKLPHDEIFHFYFGDPVKMLLLYPDGRSDTTILGSDIFIGHQIQYTVERNTWQGSFLIEGGSFALMGTTMSPAFDYADYIHGKRKELQERYPDCKKMISKLTDL